MTYSIGKGLITLKRKPPEGTFWLAEDSRRLTFPGEPELTRAFYALLEACCPFVSDSSLSFRGNSCNDLPLIPNVGEFYPRGADATLRCATPTQQMYFSSLFLHISKALGRARVSGKKEGKNLLVSLARGKITASDLDAHFGVGRYLANIAGRAGIFS